MIPDQARHFPNLPDPANETSPETPSYNCIAWATGDDQRWWQPDSFGQYYWPSQDPNAFMLAGLVAAYEAIGYVVCVAGELEQGYEKVVLYSDATGEWTHAARQLPDGLWTSKLGEGVDLTHATPDELAGPKYGQPVQFMKKAS